MKQFWKWSKNEVSSSRSELIIEGVVASESWYGDEVTPKQFRDELNAHSGDLTVRINSPGGDVYAGVSIYNALTEYDGNVTVKVDGMAASIASVIAMAGDDIQMLPGSQMMVHKPWTVAMGNSDDLEEVVAYLKKVGENVTSIYTERTGLSTERVSELLDAETWLNPEEAVELGFADKVIQPKQKSTEAVTNLLSDMKASVQAAILQPAMSLKTKLEDAQEGEAQAEPTTEPAPAEPVEEVKEDDVRTDTTDKPEEAVVEAQADTTDESTVAPEKGEDEATETKVTPEEKETQMSQTQEIAKDQVLEPQAQASVTPKVEVKNYLKTKASVEDFANVLAANAGKEAGDVKAAWKSFVETKMDITNPEVLLPEAVISSIEDAFKDGGEIWNLVNKTGLDVVTTAIDTVTGEDSRAKGHTRGNTKNEEVITLAKRTVRAQFIYKYLTLDKETVRENRSTGALLRYVLSELPKRVIREVERAIVIGDGRLDTDDNHIYSFVSVKADAADTDGYAVTHTPGATDGAYRTLVEALAKVKADGTRYLVAKSGFVTGALLEQGVNGGFLFAPGTDLAQAFRLGGIITPDWMDEDEDNDAYLVVFSQYDTVGDNSVEAFSNFVLKENKNEYLQEIYAGGALKSQAAAVAIAAPEA